MNKFYIDENNGRKYYAYTYEADKIKYVPLNHRETEILLSTIAKKPITQIISGNTYQELVFTDNIRVMVDRLRVLYPKHDEYDEYFEVLIEKAREFVTRRNLKEYTKQKKNIPRVNRTKAKSLPTKQIIGGALTFSIGISLLAGVYAQAQNRPQETQQNVSISYTVPKEINIETEKKELSADTSISLAFTTRTESNRVSDEQSKLDETIDYLGNYIKTYSQRYGLPYELACAQITQERPNFKDGVCENPCQITYKYFVGQTMTVPIYNESGFTGEYDTFTITEEMLNSTEGNIRVGLAYQRTCVDRFESLTTGLFAYNQGDAALSQACRYFNVDIEDYLGDENSIKARDLINRYYEAQGKSHGDKDYLEHVFSYLELSDRGSTTLTYYLGNELKTIEINNTLMYNNKLSR